MTDKQKATATENFNQMNAYLRFAMYRAEHDRISAINCLRMAADHNQRLESLAQELGMTYTALVKLVGGAEEKTGGA